MRRMIHALRLLTVLVLCAGAARAEKSLDIIAFGDWGAPLVDKGASPERPTATRLAYQRAVAEAMKAWMKERDVHPQAGILLGDNFYGPLSGVDDERFRINFTEMYPKDQFGFPFYFVMGNHDYEDSEHRNWKHEMDWHGDDRWRAPSAKPGATWMRVDLPPEDPLLRLYLLNNVPDGVNRGGRAYGYLGWKDQVSWLNADLKAPRKAPWLAAAAHYPPYTNGAHHKDDGPKPEKGPWFNDRPAWDMTRRDLLPPLAHAGLDFFLGGHDHNLQHITHPDWPGMDVLVSGAGGGTHPYGRHPLAPKEPFFVKGAGWVHIRFTRESAEVTFWHVKGLAIERAGAGKPVPAFHFVKSARSPSQ